jgi:hypothetical protein
MLFCSRPAWNRSVTRTTRAQDAWSRWRGFGGGVGVMVWQLKLARTRSPPKVALWCKLTPCSFGLSATSQQYFSLKTSQPPAISRQYFSFWTNQHQPWAKRTGSKANVSVERYLPCLFLSRVKPPFYVAFSTRLRDHISESRRLLCVVPFRTLYRTSMGLWFDHISWKLWVQSDPKTNATKFEFQSWRRKTLVCNIKTGLYQNFMLYLFEKELQEYK